MTGSSILITGAAGGVGSAIARRFAAQGWHVFATDENQAGLESLAQHCKLTGWHACDLTEPASCRAVVQHAIERCGRLDVLVNAAGIWREGPVDTFSEQDFDLLMQVNLKAPFFMCAAAIPHLKATRGSILNISSDAGRQGNRNAAAYCASKAGLTLFSKTLALDLAPYGVRCNAISPGDIQSPMLQFQAERYGNGDPESYFRELLVKYPQRDNARFIQPEEIAGFVYFLCQPEASSITGADLAIDNGLSAGI